MYNENFQVWRLLSDLYSKQVIISFRNMIAKPFSNET